MKSDRLWNGKRSATGGYLHQNIQGKLNYYLRCVTQFKCGQFVLHNCNYFVLELQFFHSP